MGIIYMGEGRFPKEKEKGRGSKGGRKEERKGKRRNDAGRHTLF